MEDAIKFNTMAFALKDTGIKVYMMTGDNDSLAAGVSKALGLDNYVAGLLPDQKLEKIKSSQKQGEFVAMTSDGINDAPALGRTGSGTHRLWPQLMWGLPSAPERM